MKPKLPREFLWTEITSMDEFFELDPINIDFFETFLNLREEPFGIKIDEVKVFNEVYYQTTRLFLEHPIAFDYLDIINDIKANLGWKYSAELVLSMSYWLSETNYKNSYTKIYFDSFLKKDFQDSDYWIPFCQCYNE